MTWYTDYEVNSNQSNMFLSQCLLKKFILNSYPESNYVFTCYSSYLWTYQNCQIGSIFIYFTKFKKVLIISKRIFYIKKISMTHRISRYKSSSRFLEK
jgi:hypothetical protein